MLRPLPLRVVGIIAIAMTVAAAIGCDRADARPAQGTTAALASGDRRPASAAASAVASGVAPPSAPIVGGDTLSDSLLLARIDRGRTLGAEHGTIWLVAISDFQCPYCKMWHDSTNAAVKRDYVDKGLVRLAYINLPLPQHQHARAEAEAALCAGAQSRFWEFADGLFHEQHAVERLPTVRPLIDSLARANGLDLAEFDRCRHTSVVKQILESDVQQAQRMGVRSTPTFLIGEFLLEGASPYATFKRVIDTALVVARTKKSAPK